MKMLDGFNAARSAGVPILAINTPDQNETIRVVLAYRASNAVVGKKSAPIYRWDAVQGIIPAAPVGSKAYESDARDAKGIAPDDTIGFTNAMVT